MKSFDKRRFLYRLLFYVLGLFILAMGVSISVNSNLGISPVNSLPYEVSLITGVPLSTCVIVIYCCYIFLQFLILRRKFKLIYLTEVIFSVIFGYFVDLTSLIVGDFAIPTYAGKLVMLAISIVLIALGVLIYVSVKLVPMPMEGLSLAVTEKVGIPFHNTKIIIDCIVVGVSVLLSVLAFHSLVGVREGTVSTAIVVGRVMAVFRRPLVPVIERICFGAGETNQESAEESAA